MVSAAFALDMRGVLATNLGRAMPSTALRMSTISHISVLGLPLRLRKTQQRRLRWQTML